MTLRIILVISVLISVALSAPVSQEKKADAPKTLKDALPNVEDPQIRTTLRCDICNLVSEEVMALHQSGTKDLEDALSELCEEINMDYGLVLTEDRVPQPKYAKFGDTAKGSFINHYFKENCDEFIAHNDNEILRRAQNGLDIEEVKLAMKCSDLCVGLAEDSMDDM